jgi:hypothetical protein
MMRLRFSDPDICTRGDAFVVAAWTCVLLAFGIGVNLYAMLHAGGQ